MPKIGEEIIANRISSKGLAAPMTRTYSRIVRMVLLIAGATGLLFGVLRNAPVLAAGPAQSAPPATEETRYALPSYWQGAATVSIDELGDVAPPLQIVEAVGDFQFSYVPTDDGDVIRILPDSAAEAPGRLLRLAWPLSPDDVDPALPAGQVVVLTAQARAFSPPDGVALAIREYDGEVWTSSSARMDQVQWTDYAVSRVLSADAVAVELGIEWALADANAWIELRNLAVTILPVAEEEATDLSPTDTPTPVTTPTPASAAHPAQEPSGPLIVVTSTPTPVNVFAAATQVAAATDWARVVGTATPPPDNMVTATFTPSPMIVTNTPTPANEETAVYRAAEATAIAATTGTPTPVPPDAVIVVATDTPAPAATRAQPAPNPAVRQSSPTRTPTPLFVYVDDLFFPTSTPTPAFPLELQGKILFLSDYLARNARQPNAFMINPDGSGLALMTGVEFYERAKARDAYSADKRFYAYALREPLGGRGGAIQVFWDDAEYGSTGHQLTYFGAGTAWAPAFSPVGSDTLAVVSSESGNDEIWLARRNQWPAMQLTQNEWEWDRSPSFSPDGTQIVFESNRATGTRQLWVMDAGGQNPRQITNFPFETWEPVWVKYADD